MSADEPRIAPPGRGALAFYWVLRGLGIVLGKLFFRVRAEGLEHVPAEGPFILAPVHRSNLDFMVVLICCKRRMRYLAKDSIFKPGIGQVFKALGAIPVARGTADRAALRACIDVIEAGEPLVMFPEGTRQTGPEVHDVFDGPAYVQSRTGVPIVPVGIGGSAAAMPVGSKMIRPHRITVVVGAPLPAPEGKKSIRRGAIRDQSALLKTRVQALFDQAQVRAGTPNEQAEADVVEPALPPAPAEIAGDAPPVDPVEETG
jgi:1-acyl-sn-glycerol-3-phosphate acyltransferase